MKAIKITFEIYQFILGVIVLLAILFALSKIIGSVLAMLFIHTAFIVTFVFIFVRTIEQVREVLYYENR